MSGTWHMVCTICLLNIEALYPMGTLDICCRIAANKQLPSLKACPSLIVYLLCKMKVRHLFVLSFYFTVLAPNRNCCDEMLSFWQSLYGNLPKWYCLAKKGWNKYKCAKTILFQHQKNRNYCDEMLLFWHFLYRHLPKQYCFSQKRWQQI